MRKSPLYFLDIPFEERLKNIIKTYGVYDKKELINCALKIQKRLGGLNTKNVIRFLSEGELYEAFDILLKYYDKMYGQKSAKAGGRSIFTSKSFMPGFAEIENAAFLLAE